MDLPSKERTFDFEHVGEITGKKYEGRFTVLCALNIAQKHLLALEKTRLLGSYENPTDDLMALAIILSNLRIKVVDGPEWWKQSNGGNLIEDEDALIALFKKVEEAESQWRADIKKKAQEKTQQE